MYRMTENQLILPDDFFLPFGGKLNKNNRWVILARIIPWWRVEEKYSKVFKETFKGQEALSVRVALGSLIIKERLGLSDRETVQQISENPYLQYFIGLESFQEKEPFHHSLMTHFRKHLGIDVINEVNEWIVLEEQTHDSQDESDDNAPTNNGSSSRDHKPAPKDKSSNSNKGKIILDATCAPSDIAYPTDIGLLNEAREKLEEMIDVLHAPYRGHRRKPRVPIVRKHVKLT